MLSNYEIWFENTKDYLFECAWQFCSGVIKWTQYGGWHRFIVFVVFIACIIALKWLWERLKAWLDDFGNGGRND